LNNCLSPNGIYFVTYGDDLVATAGAFHRGGEGNQIGEVGWVAADPAHKGKMLGMAVCEAAINHLLNLGYEEIFLLTDHWRYPALKTYLKLGFEPRRDGPDDRYLWDKICKKLGLPLSEPKKAKYIKHPTGEEVAWRTLQKERVQEPCIITGWCMKRQFFQALAHCNNIYTEEAPDIVIEAFIRAGANLCPQFIMPSPTEDREHTAYNPFAVVENLKPQKASATKINTPTSKSITSPEDVRDEMDALPEPDTLERNFNIEAHGESYAKGIMKLRDMAGGEMLFVSGFGQPDFMGGYGRWGYINYLSALSLYPESVEKYYAYTGEYGRLTNIAIAYTIKKYGLAPFVYSGQDICYNDGPLCSIDILDKIYFPHLARAVKPLNDQGIGVIWHSDGNILPILDQLIEKVGVAGFQGFQEETGCTLEKIAARKTCKGEKLILWGSISVTTTLPFGTVDDVKESVERCFKIAAPGGGFALAPTSSILPETPLENILTMYNHGQRFG
ncbi:GNAT family N-acetyltransferase, partial [Candidatus Poribacteria bacterium]|nr:GNAT family N-acetyltransferase [Candidatus Poribacteria bacterium]